MKSALRATRVEEDLQVSYGFVDRIREDVFVNVGDAILKCDFRYSVIDLIVNNPLLQECIYLVDPSSIINFERGRMIMNYWQHYYSMENLVLVINHIPL